MAEYYLQHRKSEDLDFFTQVESLYDIAVDKAQTISVRPRSRDLSRKSQEKFEIVVDPLQLGEFFCAKIVFVRALSSAG